MSSRKLCVVVMVATISAISALAILHLHSNDLHTDGRYTNISGSGTYHAQRETPPAVLLPVQSKNTKALGLGKILVASRDMGDPRFAESVILLVRYDDQGVVGLVLNRRTKLPIQLECAGQHLTHGTFEFGLRLFLSIRHLSCLIAYIPWQHCNQLTS